MSGVLLFIIVMVMLCASPLLLANQQYYLLGVLIALCFGIGVVACISKTCDALEADYMAGKFDIERYHSNDFDAIYTLTYRDTGRSMRVYADFFPMPYVSLDCEMSIDIPGVRLWLFIRRVHRDNGKSCAPYRYQSSYALEERLRCVN